ncbi:MAG: PepSY domain-containing protein [Eubacteriales bacterium]|nr:PepSY domain-containing protein [Eubacteriales bacterium]
MAQEEAVKLALDRVPGSTEQDLRIELEYDDGYYKYEGDIIYNQIEYEFEIDANTGAFLEWSEERR